jgi:hypothetical protein
VPDLGKEWIITTREGHFHGSAGVAPFIRWNVDGVLAPAEEYWDLFHRPDLVRRAWTERGCPLRERRVTP